MTNKNDEIILKGLKENNLKNINVSIPKEKLIVFTGLSGSGKSSVVFDTLATESRRQMMLNHPHYIRNQMPRYERPNADLMQHLSPVVVVEQKAISRNSTSTVGTYMDIDPLIRLLFSRIGTPPIHNATDFTRQSDFGKCPECNGYGEVITPSIEKMIDVDKSLKNYAVKFKPLSPSGWQGRWMITGGLFDPDKPIKNYTEAEYQLLIEGPPEGEKVFAPFHTKNGPQPHEWDGLVPRFKRLYINRDISKLKQVSESDILEVTSQKKCPVCAGSGLNPQVLTCKINGLHIENYNNLELTSLLKELTNITDPVGAAIALQIINHMKQLVDIGLGYLNLSRKMNTLSGGEAQRTKIARHLGSSLNNMIYIFDEPSAGLHQEEVALLIQMIKKIKEHHNTVIVIEHDRSVIKTADQIIEMGPQAGVHGGEVMYQGSVADVENVEIAKKLKSNVKINRNPRKTNQYYSIQNANQYNLKNISIHIPKNVFVSVCGVSGSGKSTLLRKAFFEKHPESIVVGQESIGVSNRSTLATYMGIMDDIRSMYAKHTKQPVGLFSFNSLGACPYCNGKGVTMPDVAFADPITVTCEACNGTRYSDKALSYKIDGRNIVETLQLTVHEALVQFPNPNMKRRIETLCDVGLGYLTLGQTTSSLSGGEVQRLKLASQLHKKGQVYIIDEPSVGLHPKDNEKVLHMLQTLVERGNSVIITEHQLEFIAASDWIIELGPTGGDGGGYVLFEGTPEEMLQANTLTSKWLNKHIT